MRRFAIEVVLAAVIGCGGAGTRAPAEPARSSADPVVVALRDDRGASLEGGLEGAPRPPSAATSAPQEPPAVAPVPSAQALATPARSTTIRLSSPAGGPGDAELAAGDEAFERGDLAEAQRHYRAARSAGAREPAPAVGLARVTIARLDLPLDYAAARDNATVAAVARELAQAVKSGPPFGPAFVELGRARLLLGDADGAIDALKIGVGLLSQEPEAHSQLGVALLATGHSDGAVRELSRALDLDPGNAARHGNLGTALLMLGRTREAIAEYEARVRMADGDSRAHSDLGTALLGTQDIDRALSELERAIGIEPTRASYHSNLGYALQEMGRRDRAIGEYREALRLDPRLVSAWINLGTVLARDPKTRAEAREALARAQSLSPADPRVKANIEELDALESHGSTRQPTAPNNH